MKKLFIGCACLALLASCNVKNSSEYKALQAEKDSLAQLNAKSNGELTEMMGVINDVEENFRQIKEAEKYLTIESQGKGEMNSDTKTRVRDDFAMINDMLQKNKDQINKLNQRLKNSGGENSSLKKMVERLNAELQDRGKTIADLQAALTKRDAQIAELEVNMKNLNDNVETLNAQAQKQAETIKQQDKEINSAYYMFGTGKELKESKVISGGFLASTKVLSQNIERSKFIKIDIHDLKSIPVYAKKAKVLSEHPKDSYKLEKDNTDNVVLKISDYQKFWSLTRYLIIEVN